MWKILMFEIFAKNGLCDVFLSSEVKTSDFAAHFSRNSGAANTVIYIYIYIYNHFLSYLAILRTGAITRRLPADAPVTSE